MRKSDIVKVKHPSKKTPFLARVREIVRRDDGHLEVEIIIWAKLNGDPHGQRGKWHIVTEDDITRVSQTKWAHLRSDAEAAA